MVRSLFAALPLAALFVVAAVPGQNRVFPRGLAYMEGAAGNSVNFKFDEKRFRMLLWLPASEFPWDASQDFTIRGMKLRRANGVVFNLDGHKKTGFVKISTNGGRPGDAAQTDLRFDDLHGADVVTREPANAFDFHASGRIPQDGAARVFEADIAFKPGEEFTVLAGREDLILEFIVLENPTEPGQNGDSAEDYPVDSEASLVDRGGMVRFGGFCPAVDPACDSDVDRACAMAQAGTNGAWPGNTTRIWVASGAPENSRACGWIGARLQHGIPLPWTPCELLVDPIQFFPGNVDAFDSNIGKFEVLLPVPDDGTLIGRSFGFQFAVCNPDWANGLGVSSGLEVTIGSGGPSDSRFRMVFAAVGAADPLPEIGTLEIATPVIEFY